VCVESGNFVIIPSCCDDCLNFQNLLLLNCNLQWPPEGQKLGVDRDDEVVKGMRVEGDPEVEKEEGIMMSKDPIREKLQEGHLHQKIDEGGIVVEMTDDEQDPGVIRDQTGIEVVINEGIIVTGDLILESWQEEDPILQKDKEITLEMTDNEQDQEVIKEEGKDQVPTIVEMLTEKFLTLRSHLVLIKPFRKNCCVLLRVLTAPMEVA